MPAVGSTAVLALVPEAEELLTAAAGVDPRVVRAGVPAHAALLYPWLPVDGIDAAQLDRLRAAVRGAPVRIRLAEVERNGGFVGIPVPELRALATAARLAFPEHTPYGGRFGQDPPVHVTVALDAEPGVAQRIAGLTRARLPVEAKVSALHVVGLTAGGWQPLAEPIALEL
jgi:hypothetical protein